MCIGAVGGRACGISRGGVGRIRGVGNIRGAEGQIALLYASLKLIMLALLLLLGAGCEGSAAWRLG